MNSPQHNATSISAFNISNVYYIIEIGMCPITCNLVHILHFFAFVDVLLLQFQSL